MVRRILISIIFSLAVTSNAFAQTPPPPPAAGAAGEQKSSALSGPRRQLATIVFAGLGGAILGLSTLSFYGRPQEKLNNIAIGFAFGIIAGTSYVTYKAATNPQELYGSERRVLPQIEADLAQSNAPTYDPQQIAFTFEF